jgi:predicted nucleic acid-binding protein
VVLDTNVFVAAGFNPASASARLLDRVRAGELRLVWNEETRAETERILNRIPRLPANLAADLFDEDGLYPGETFPGRFDYISDPEDRKFAALAEAAGAALITSDRHLLEHRERAAFGIFTPGEYWRGPL